MRNYRHGLLAEKKNRQMLVVEMKAKHYIGTETEKVVKGIERLDLEYEVLTTDRDEMGFENIN
jgi:hypothetical protein